ncbi:MAG TPA: LytTR family DNA-binding domain-containing protein [Algoriphagus sp.]|nr:LytTR family DNA-binding domain-containing protein [Algoriphagus sp.]
MKKVVIIEDEIPSRKKVKEFIQRLGQEVEIVAELASVEEAIGFLQKSDSIDLIISDIQLLDGVCFEIFDQIEVNSPVIFTTAYDKYWMEAFEANGIDYLLKPFGFDRFLKSWEKFIRLSRTESDSKTDLLDRIRSMVGSQTISSRTPKTRIMVYSNAGMYFLEISEIPFFLAENGVVKATDSRGKSHLLRQSTLKEIEDIVDPNCFFRINRSYLINKSFVEKLERYSKNTVSIVLKNSKESFITSQSSTSGFLDWLEK